MTVRSSPTANLTTRRRFLQNALLGATAVALPGCSWRLADIQNQVGTVVANTDKLNLYTWSSYINDDLLTAFQGETGVKGVTEIMASNEEMIAAFEAGKGRVFSLLYPSDYAVALMHAKHYLQPLDVTRIDDLETLLPNLAKVGVIDGKRYSVPITWGTTGLLYNSDKISVPPTDWAYLWDNKEKLTRKFTLLDDPREVLGMTLHRLGYSQNTTDLGQLEQAYKQLQALKPHLANFTTDAWREPLLAGDLWMAMAYSTDASDLIKENPQIRYVIPPSGTNLWVDTMVIPVTAPNPKSAYAWINYVTNPERAAQLTEKLGYVPTTQAAIDLLPEAVRQDPIKFPPAAILAKCETMQTLPEAVTAKIEQYWTQIKT
jgi:spermidine/putrescine transport system substrate-binding protein